MWFRLGCCFRMCLWFNAGVLLQAVYCFSPPAVVESCALPASHEVKHFHLLVFNLLLTNFSKCS